jgi:hypothetical protein
MRRVTTAFVVGCVVGASATAFAEPRFCSQLRSFYGCDSPAFFDAGIYTRRFAGTPTPGTAFRTTEPVTAEPTATALTGDIRFGLDLPHSAFVAIEGEFGSLTLPGSNVAGVYAVAGAKGATRLATLFAELAGGSRTVRYSLSSADYTKWILEPRVRGEIWLSQQFTLGVTAGATLSDRQVWMMGIYLGVHSQAFDGLR